MKPCIVVSGVNLVEAGPLAVFKDALHELAHHYSEIYRIIALVHRADTVSVSGVEYLEFPHVKSSWMSRVKFEYWDCRSLSQKLDARLWLAMHDMTPNVTAAIRAVYCHNPSPFYKLGIDEAFIDWKFTLFALFYRFLYAINIRRNRFVIVQQQWIREEFLRRYPVRQVIVAHPSIPSISTMSLTALPAKGANYNFFYPAFPRLFKNMEIILEAVQILEESGLHSFEVWLTVSGRENRYARALRSRFKHLHNIRWLGKVAREEVYERYMQADCLIFPSRLETWGMPISEFKETGRPMLVADLPYAHETVGAYSSVRFFPPENAEILAGYMKASIEGTLEFESSVPKVIETPYARSWLELFRIILN